jgi:zinc transporter ZupT
MYEQILIPTLLTVLATGLGAIPFFFIKNIKPNQILYGNVVTAGLMLTASFLLIQEGASDSSILTVLGVALGLLFILGSHAFLAGKKELSIAKLSQASTIQALMIVGIMTIHSFAEGMGIGASFGSSEEFGIFIAIIMAIQNIPEGLAIALILVPLGVRPITATFWAIFSSLPQLLIAIPSFVFVSSFTQLLPVGLGFAGGAMIWMVGSEILPENLTTDKPTKMLGTILTVSITAMIVVNILLQNLSN